MLTYKGHPVRRIMETRVGGETKYIVETAHESTIVSAYQVGAEGGTDEVIRIAKMTRGNVLGR